MRRYLCCSFSQEFRRICGFWEIHIDESTGAFMEEKAIDTLLRITDGMEFHETLIAIQPTKISLLIPI